MSESAPWDAASYDEVASVQFEWGRRVIPRRKWRGDEVVLDAGCGTGQLAEEILKLVPRGRVIAVDLDSAMVKRARERLGRHGARATVREADLLSLSGIEPVDVIFSNAVLHWIPDHDAVFAVFLHHLKPGGEVLVQCGGEGNLARVHAVCAGIMKESGFAAQFRDWKAPWRLEDDASTEERLLIAGFVHPNVTLDPAPTAFPNRDAFARFARAVVLRPYLALLRDENQREAFVDAFVQGCERAGLGHTLDYVRLNIQAQRSPHA